VVLAASTLPRIRRVRRASQRGEFRDGPQVPQSWTWPSASAVLGNILSGLSVQVTMRMFTAIAGIVGLCCEIAIAQVDSAPKFDVVSIRRSAPESEPFVKAHPGGRLEISRATLRTLTALAHRLQPFQVSGGPSWVRSEYFSINTKAVENPSEDRLFLMIQALLAERFSLKLHFETKEQPVYVLVVGKIGKRSPTGLQITTEGSCVRVDSSAPPDPKACGSLGMGLNHLEAQEISMARFAEALTRVLDRKVIDRTGRPEKFNVSLQWAPDEHQALPSSDAIALPPDTPSIFTAVQEQLGLKLEPSKAPIELLVIDHAERPSEN
jgi:uncharacterized protein (TIGR03435 family)